jgi:hypothetical protein
MHSRHYIIILLQLTIAAEIKMPLYPILTIPKTFIPTKSRSARLLLQAYQNGFSKNY